jgi:hypothetical protein
MFGDGEEVAIVALRKEHYSDNKPPLPSITKECNECGEEVWVALKQFAMPELDVHGENVSAICFECFKEKA